MGAWSWLSATTPAAELPAPPPAPTPSNLSARLWAVVEARAAGELVHTRDQAMRLSVVNRARDLVCGTVGRFPFVRTRYRDGQVTDIGAGWLVRPDPAHTRAWWVAQLVDDLMFHGLAYCEIAARVDDLVVALRWLPWTETVVDRVTGDGEHRDPLAGETRTVPAADLVTFESALSPLLPFGADAMATAVRLDAAARRFASTDLAVGWLRQVAGEALDNAEATALVERWIAARQTNTVAYLSPELEWVESTMDPDKLQLVEARSYQDAQLARLCNVPNFAVGVGVPNDSMTYKTALSARLDLLDFGVWPYVECLTQTLSSDQCTPRGTVVDMDPSSFLRTAALTPGETPPP